MSDLDVSSQMLHSKVAWYLVAYHQQIIVKAEEMEMKGLVVGSQKLIKKAEEIEQVIREFQALHQI